MNVTCLMINFPHGKGALAFVAPNTRVVHLSTEIFLAGEFGFVALIGNCRGVNTKARAMKTISFV